ncbi:UvrD-helicase domain-containing protein [Halobacteriaceae archaeon SHR40]|uniref:UvrD-helicase domain-containing protein n=1 Tax=Halovenus amylolytica TaxID=2500550 RepID=UPI000FE2FB91
MSRLLSAIRQLFSAGSESEPVDPDAILHGTEEDDGVIKVATELSAWQESYLENYVDYLTVYEALDTYETASAAMDQLEPLLSDLDNQNEDVVDAAETLEGDLQQVLDFIESREEYNEAWIDEMTQQYGAELNDFFEDPEAEHTNQQFRAIFSNDNFNRVNAAAGTGKTTTFGRRVHFILSEFDNLAATDLLAITFTRPGREEMKKELDETFDITGVDVRTVNSYSKSVAEEHYPDLDFIVDEAKDTEIARIWRSINQTEQFADTYETFLEAWKDSRYDPNDVDAVNGVYESHDSKATLTVQAEEVEIDDIPEEAIAHKAIARVLTSLELEYDYQTHLKWASSPTGGYVIDFELVEPINGERVYIEYCPSEETKDTRPGYRNSNSEKPETIQRIFTQNEQLDGDPSGKIVITLDGGDILRDPADELNWGDDRVTDRFATNVQSSLETELQQRGIDVADRTTGQDLRDYVYDRKILYHDIVESVKSFINQARVREWDPEEAERKVTEYLDDQGDDVDPGVREFTTLALAAYRKFTGVFDNRTKTDFHGSLVLARELLKDGKVSEEFLYKHVFVDEMQDLNRLQFGIVKQLAKQQENVRTFGVGDDWQSIFGFQGARPDLFINFGEELDAGTYADFDAEPVEMFSDENPILAEFDAYVDTRMEDNYRCPDSVVNASNTVIKNNEVRTEKDPSGRSGGEMIDVHHLGCDLFPNKLNQSMEQKISSLIRHSPYDPGETQVLLRQKDGDPSFYYPLKDTLPDAVDIRTAHNSKGSEAEHVIIPKVIETGGYPSIQSDKWVRPVKHPPKIYEEHGVSYQLEEERRLFYVALTRAKSQLDVLTVQGGESVFIDELPNALCDHLRPLSEDELEEVADSELRKRVEGKLVAQYNQGYATFEWDGRGLIDLNLYDATDAQYAQVQELIDGDETVTLDNCGIQYRSTANDDSDAVRLQLQLDKNVSIATN